MRQLLIDFDAPDPDTCAAPQTSPIDKSPQRTLEDSFSRNRLRYFGGLSPVEGPVSFGLLRASSFRTIGRADISRGRITLHPTLIQPPWDDLLDFVMYHEMLHFVEFHHNRRFRELERRFEDYARIRERETSLFLHLEHQHGLRHRYIYKCPACASAFYFRTRRGHLYSCSQCGGKRYDERFRLQLMSSPEKPPGRRRQSPRKR